MSDEINGAIDILLEAARGQIALSEGSLLRLEQKVRRAALEKRRILTYTNQPDNVGAWRLGEACRRAANDPNCGDYIDRGLILLRELEAKGYGVVKLTAAPEDDHE